KKIFWGLNPGSWDIALVLHQVDESEEQHPDEVDEVPVETAELDAQVIRGGVFPADRPDPQTEQPDHADDDVQAVETGHRIEGRPEDVVVGRPSFQDQL